MTWPEIVHCPDWEITDWHHSQEEGWHADLIYGNDGLVIIRDKEIWEALYFIRYG